MSLEERELEVLIGPQHPASGHMRLVAKIDGVAKTRPLFSVSSIISFLKIILTKI